MVPVSTNLVRHGKVVDKVVAWSDWTLGDKFRTVHLGGTVLEQTVEMERGVLVTQTVDQLQNDSVTSLDFEGGQGPRAIEPNDGSFHNPIGVSRGPGGIEVPVVVLSTNQGQKERDHQHRKLLHCAPVLIFLTLTFLLATSNE